MRVESVARLHLQARDDAWARNEMGPPGIADILLTLEPLGLEWIAVTIADAADPDNPPSIVVFCPHPSRGVPSGVSRIVSSSLPASS